MTTHNAADLSSEIPPSLTAAQRKRNFYTDSVFKKEISEKVRGDNNLVCIVVAYGYFKATRQFFNTANQVDIDFVCRKFELPKGSIKWGDYQKKTRDRHRLLILDVLGYKPFDENDIPEIDQILYSHARAQRNKTTACQNVFEHLVKHGYEIPSYSKVLEIVDRKYQDHENKISLNLASSLSNTTRNLLDSLFTKSSEEDCYSTYRLTFVKRFSHSIKPSKIKENVNAYDLLYDIFREIQPHIEFLDLTKDGIKKYAYRVSKSQVFEIKQKPDISRHLHLVCFVIHRLYELTDIFEKAISATVKSFQNEMSKKAKEEHLKHSDQQTSNTQDLVDDTEKIIEALTVISNAKSTLKNDKYTDKQKISKALRILSKASADKEKIEANIESVKSDLKLTYPALLLRFLEEHSAKLHLRCKEMVIRLAFDPESTNKPLLRVIKRFKSSNGKVDSKFPTSHLSSKEVINIYNGISFSSGLYKVYFYKHIADSFKSDSLNLLYSYTNRRFDEYWISKRRWEKDREVILRQLGMEATLDFESYLEELAGKIDAQFHETNDHILNNDNPYVLIDYEGGYTTTAQKKNIAGDLEFNNDEIEELYKLDRNVTLTEAIATVNRACGFLGEFQHFNNKTNLKRPDNSILMAGLIAHGQHIGLSKLAKHAPDINLNSLERASNAYFNLENLLRVNDTILRFVDNMPLANRFKTKFGLQTSSDGQKWIVTKDSFNASASFKYGGKDIVLSEYGFIDCRGLFLHSDVFSGATKEAHYLMDGLVKNEVVRSDLHSTDTHGYTEAVFGVSHLLGYSFAPRIKNIHKQYLYGSKYRSHYGKKGYPILPNHKINFDKIRKHSDDILRMVASIGIGEVTASQIFRKLNSYAEENNELYEAIKEFGRMIKTIFILRYVDNKDLRDAIQKQLNKGENGNKMDRALILGRMEYNISEPVDQEISECCKKILKNIIVCWNYMYLTKKLDSASSYTDKARILDNIDSSLILTWSHFLTHGKFEFSNQQLKDSMNFDFSKMHDPSVIDPFKPFKD